MRHYLLRSGFDTSFVVLNDERTGMVKYVGQKHTVIEYDESLHQWNMTVVNQPSIRGHSSTELSGLTIGTQSWTILGDQGCQSKPQTIKLSLRK